jgi:hypothetical protein
LDGVINIDVPIAVGPNALLLAGYCFSQLIGGTYPFWEKAETLMNERIVISITLKKALKHRIGSFRGQKFSPDYLLKPAAILKIIRPASKERTWIGYFWLPGGFYNGYGISAIRAFRITYFQDRIRMYVSKTGPKRFLSACGIRC